MPRTAGTPWPLPTPYETVNCYVWEGRDECSVINGIADFAFVVDAATGLVTEITYVGGA
jgi:hypothetical protein